METLLSATSWRLIAVKLVLKSRFNHVKKKKVLYWFMGKMWSLSGLLEWYFKEQLVSDGNARYTSRPLKLTAEETIYSTICNSSDLTLCFRHTEIVPQNPDGCFPLLNLWSRSLHPMALEKEKKKGPTHSDPTHVQTCTCTLSSSSKCCYGNQNLPSLIGCLNLSWATFCMFLFLVEN